VQLESILTYISFPEHPCVEHLKLLIGYLIIKNLRESLRCNMKSYFWGRSGEMQRRVKVKILDNEAHIGELTLRELIRMLESLRNVDVEIEVVPSLT